MYLQLRPFERPYSLVLVARYQFPTDRHRCAVHRERRATGPRRRWVLRQHRHVDTKTPGPSGSRAKEGKLVRDSGPLHAVRYHCASRRARDGPQKCANFTCFSPTLSPKKANCSPTYCPATTGSKFREMQGCTPDSKQVKYREIRPRCRPFYGGAYFCYKYFESIAIYGSNVVVSQRIFERNTVFKPPRTAGREESAALQQGTPQK